MDTDSSIDARFEILALAGAGGMGRVYRARDRATGNIVAVKVLGACVEPARLAREAEALAAIDHPGVVRYLGAGQTDDGRPYLVMEWLSGYDLADRIFRGVMNADEVIVLAKRIAEPLAAAHRRGIVHRDVKPANVLLVDGDVERVKIIDFGLARHHDDALITADGAVVGTPASMAPEQIRGEAVDARADVYGIGAVLFTCLVGRPPFGGAHRIAVLAKAVAEPPPRVRDLRDDVPDALDAFIARLLTKERELRPADAGEVALEIAALSHGPIERRAPSAITDKERRVACVVLCDVAPSPEDLTAVEHRSDAERSARPRPTPGSSAVEEVVEDIGGTFHALSRETALVTIRGSAAPSEQAARAARCALAIAATRPGAPLVVATGQIVSFGGGVQVGEVIDRATQELVGAMRAGVGKVLVDAATAALLGDRFVLRGEGPFAELVGERGEEAGRYGRTFLGRPAPCVGRAGELGSLEAALRECMTEPRARAVLIVAPAGTGKSRLVHELRARVAGELAADVLVAGADPVRASSSLGVVGKLVRRRAGIAEADAPDARARKLHAMVTRTVAAAEVERVEAFLGEIAGVYASPRAAPPSLRAARADTATMADGVREAWLTWLAALAARKPVVVVVEDVHWADAASLRLLDAALGELEGQPLLVIGTARPEIATTAPDLFKKRALQEIHLGPLPARAARAFVEATLGPDADAAVVDALVTRAGGHPFFLEELVRAVASGLGPDALPTSILGMIQLRLDELPPGARRVLRAGSVFGATFTAAGVAALLGTQASGADIAADLRELVERELVQRVKARAGASVEHAFRHALVRDAAYATLTEQDKALAHRLAGAWLEEAPDADPVVLAEHFDRGGAPARALVQFRRAAKAALGRSDLERATALAERALACGPDEPSRGALWAIEAEVSYWRGDLDAASARAAGAVDRLAEGTAPWFEAASAAIGALGQRGKNDEVAAWLARVAAAPPAPDCREAAIVALCRGVTQLVWAHHAGDLRAVRERIERLADPLDDLGAYESGWVHRVRAETAWVHDRHVDRCLAAFEASTRAFERAHAQRFACLTAMNHASLGGWSGDVEEALERASAAGQGAERSGWTFLAVYARAVSGMLEVFAGRPGGEEALRDVLPKVAGSPRLVFVCHVLAGWCALDRALDLEDVELAEADARAAIATPVVDAIAPAGRAVLARALAARGALDEALVEAQAAVAAARTAPDLELFEGLPSLALADVHRARHEPDLADAAIEEAYERLEAVARTISASDRRERFWSRKVGNDRIRALRCAPP